MLTAEDDVIRALDIPERFQIASVGIPTLPPSDDGSAIPYLSEEEIRATAAEWVVTKISSRCTEEFCLSNEEGDMPRLYAQFFAAVSEVLIYINCQFLEVPFIKANRPDICVYMNEDEPETIHTPVSFLGEDDLWKISALSVKYRALSYRKKELKSLFESLEIEDDEDTQYFKDVFDELATVEEVADAMRWISMTYSAKVREVKERAREEEEDDDMGETRRKRVTREDWYEQSKTRVVSQFAKVISSSARSFW
jgi:transcription elongation factor SPT6